MTSAPPGPAARAPNPARATPSAIPRAYPGRPWLAVSVALRRAGQVLKIRRARPPGEGEWQYPGGAVRLGETIEQAARRELLEETGLAAGPLRLAGATDRIEHDSAGIVQYHYVILTFTAPWIGGEPKAQADATEAAWFQDTEQ